jgi:plastocyanin
MKEAPMRKLFALLAVGLVAALGLVACGDDDDDDGGSDTSAATTTTETGGGGGAGGTISVSAAADGSLQFDQTELTATAGTNTVEFDNPSQVAHNVEIEDSSGEDVAGTDTITGSTTTTTADLQPGTYKFYCSVDGHEAAGMEGTLTVK